MLSVLDRFETWQGLTLTVGRRRRASFSPSNRRPRAVATPRATTLAPGNYQQNASPSDSQYPHLVHYAISSCSKFFANFSKIDLVKDSDYRKKVGCWQNSFMDIWKYLKLLGFCTLWIKITFILNRTRKKEDGTKKITKLSVPPTSKR